MLKITIPPVQINPPQDDIAVDQQIRSKIDRRRMGLHQWGMPVFYYFRDKQG